MKQLNTLVCFHPPLQWLESNVIPTHAISTHNLIRASSIISTFQHQLQSGTIFGSACPSVHKYGKGETRPNVLFLGTFPTQVASGSTPWNPGGQTAEGRNLFPISRQSYTHRLLFYYYFYYVGEPACFPCNSKKHHISSLPPRPGAADSDLRAYSYKALGHY